MLLGIISDTHGLLRPEVFEAFDGVDHIVHAGDVGDPDILLGLAAMAPVTAVWGNTDGPPICDNLPAMATVQLEGVLVVVLHGHGHGSPTARGMGRAHPEAGLVVFGHSHQPEIERVEGVLAVNPGSAGPARFKLPITVALAEITGGAVKARVVEIVKR